MTTQATHRSSPALRLKLILAAPAADPPVARAKDDSEWRA